MRGRKRYVIIPIIFAIFLPLSMWLSDNEGMSYLDYI
nr:bacteriocin-like prepeptide [Ligilactobacillus salivarius]